MTIFLAALFVHLLDWNWYQSIFFGCIVSLSSTAVVLNSLMHLKWMEAPYGRIAAGILLFQDISLIPMMILLPGLALSSIPQIHLSFTTLSLRAILLSFFLIIFGRWGIKPLLDAVTRTRSKELFVTTLLALALGIATLSQWAGLSFAIGSFFAGMLIGLTQYQHHALAEISPFRYAFSSLFFVAIGMLFNTHFFFENIGLICSLAVFLPIIKVLITALVVLFFGYPIKTAIITGLLLGQLGEFSFLLAQLGMDLQIIQLPLYNLIIALTVITLFITPLMVRAAPVVGDWVGDVRWLRHLSTPQLHETHPAKKILNNHVIICGFGPLGETLGYFLEEIHVPYIVLELNPLTARRLSGKDRPVLIGDGANVELLEQAQIHRARAIAITAPDHMNIVSIIKRAKELNPNIEIITRSRYRNQTENLYAEGADVVISEELESGIEMSRYLLELFGMPREDVKARLDKIREFGSADFF